MSAEEPVDLARREALDALHDLRDRLVTARNDHEVQMVRHYGLSQDERLFLEETHVPQHIEDEVGANGVGEHGPASGVVEIVW